MKKITLTVFSRLLSLILTLCLFLFGFFFLYGCQSRTSSSDPFAVFSGDFTAELCTEVNGSRSECLYKKEGARVSLSFTSPEALCGFSFLSDDSGLFLSYGDISVEAGERLSFLPRLISDALSASPEEITEITTEKTKKSDETEAVITVIKTADTVFHFGDCGTPLYLEGTVNGVAIRFTFSSFSGPQVSL